MNFDGFLVDGTAGLTLDVFVYTEVPLIPAADKESSMSNTLICTLGKLDRYKVTTRDYRLGERDVGRFDIPASAVACAYANEIERIVLICPGEASETGEWMLEELTDKNLPTPIIEVVPIPHDADGIDALLSALAALFRREVAINNTFHLDFSLGLRAISLSVLLSADYLCSAAGGRVGRVTCINQEAPATREVPEIMEITPYLYLERLRACAESLVRQGDIAGVADTVATAFPGSLSEEDLREAHELQRRLLMLRTDQIASNKGRLLLGRIIRTLEEQARRLPLLAPIAETLRHHLSPLDPGNMDKHAPPVVARLARWYLEHGQPALALLLIDEAADIYAYNTTDAPPGETFRLLAQETGKARNSLAHAQFFFDQSAAALDIQKIREHVVEFERLSQIIRVRETLEKPPRKS